MRLLLIFFLKPSSNFNSLSPSYTEIAIARDIRHLEEKVMRSFLDNRMIFIANKQFNEISTNIVKHIQYLCMMLCLLMLCECIISFNVIRYNHYMFSYFLSYICLKCLELYGLISYPFLNSSL